MTHPILGFWGTVLIGIIVAATAIGLVRQGMWRRAVYCFGALVCAPGLAAVYVVPAIVYRKSAHTDIMATGWSNPQHQWLQFDSLFFGKSAPFFSVNFFRVGPLIVTALAAVGIALVLNFRNGRRATGWMALSLALVGLTLPQGSWFWVPGRIPTAEFVQFPWRMLGPAVLTASVALGIAMVAATERWGDRLRNGIAITGGAALLLGCSWTFVAARPMATEAIPNTGDAIRQGLYSAMDEDGYLPRTAPTPPRAPRRELAVSTDGVVAEDVISDGAQHGLTVRAARNGASLVLALHAFPGWAVETVSGPSEASTDVDPRGLLRLHLPIAGDYRLRVWYSSPPAERLGTLFGVVAGLVLIAMLAQARLFSWWQSRLRRRAIVDAPRSVP